MGLITFVEGAGQVQESSARVVPGGDAPPRSAAVAVQTPLPPWPVRPPPPPFQLDFPAALFRSSPSSGPRWSKVTKSSSLGRSTMGLRG